MQGLVGDIRLANLDIREFAMSWSNLFSTKISILLIMPIVLISVIDNAIAAERFAEDRSEIYLEKSYGLNMQGPFK